MLSSHEAAELSHDMAVPLTSIIASLDLLDEELGGHPSSPEAAALLERARRASDRMLRMLRNLETDHSAAEPVMADVDLGKVAFQLAVDSAGLLELADATVDIGCLPVVRANPDEMYSILQNLLTNAVKFARPGIRPRVTISARQVQDAWRVSVSDNGIGIPESRRVDIFSPFTRVGSQVEGHGIGLGTVAHTVAACGGRVGAEEADGGGAEVWFELPATLDGVPPGDQAVGPGSSAL